MSLFLLLRTVRHHRVALVIGFVMAGAVAVLTLYRVSPGLPPALPSRNEHAGVATQHLLVDTTRSQVSAQGGGSPVDGTATALFGLVGRANLMAGLLMTSDFGRRISAGAGLKGRPLVVIPPEGMGPPIQGGRLDPTKLGAQATVLEIVVDESIPVITLKARAPDEATARRVTDSAARSLREHVSEQGASHAVPEAARLVVLPTGEPISDSVVIGPSKLLAIAVFLALSSLWLAVLVMWDRLPIWWRRLGDWPGGSPSAARDVFVRSRVRPARK